jgi:hypothetical protein
MQGEDGEDVLPLADFGRDAGAALFWGNDDHMVDNAQAFGFGLGLNRAGRFGFGDADTVEPVTNAGHIESQPNSRASTAGVTHRDRCRARATLFSDARTNTSRDDLSPCLTSVCNPTSASFRRSCSSCSVALDEPGKLARA